MSDMVTIKVKTESPRFVVEQFIKEHFGEIDKDIDVIPMYDRYSWDREHTLTGIQFNVGGYGDKTFKRALIKDGAISLVKIQNIIDEFTKFAENKRRGIEVGKQYQDKLRIQLDLLYEELTNQGYIRESTGYVIYGNPKNGIVEAELKHVSLNNGEITASVTLHIGKKLTKEQIHKVLEYVKEINQIVS